MEIGESIFIQVSASAADNKIQQLAKKSQLLPITKFKNCKTFNKIFFELSALTINCNTDGQDKSGSNALSDVYMFRWLAS